MTIPHSTVDNKTDLQQLSPQPTHDAPLNVTRARSIWIDGLLILLTAGIYSQFLLVSMVRDLKKLTDDSTLKPWLWYFVPAIALSQIVALPKLNRKLGNYEEQLKINNQSSKFTLWITLTILVSIGYSMVFRLSDLEWLWLVASFVYTGTFLIWVYRLKTAKVADPRVALAKREVQWWEWTTLAIASLFWLVITSLYGYSELNTETLEAYESNTVFVDEDLGLTFPMNNWPWIRIQEEGTDAIHAFEAFDLELYGYIFDYKNQSVNSLAKRRYKEFLEDEGEVECEEYQSFQHQTLYLRSILTCSYDSLFGEITESHTIINNGDKTFELYLYADPMDHDAEDILDALKDAAQGFKIK